MMAICTQMTINVSPPAHIQTYHPTHFQSTTLQHTHSLPLHFHLLSPPLNTTSYTLLPRAHTPPPLASQQHMVPHPHTNTHTTQTKPTHTGCKTHPCNVNRPYCLPTLLYLQCCSYWTNRCTLNTCMLAVVLYPFYMLMNILLIQTKIVYSNILCALDLPTCIDNLWVRRRHNKT